MSLVDKDGNEIAAAKPQPHKFGQFVIPENCHIKGFDAMPIHHNPPTWRAWVQPRSEARDK